MFASESHDDSVAGIHLHRPAGQSVGVQGIDRIRRRIPLGLDDAFHERVVEHRALGPPHGDAFADQGPGQVADGRRAHDAGG